MAKDSLGTIIGLGAAGFAAYWLYSNRGTLFAAPAVVAPPAGTGTGVQPAPTTPTSTDTAPTGKGGGINPAALPPYMANLAALTTQLQTMAGSPNQSIDQWAFYYNQLRQQRNMPELTGAQVSAILAVSPATAADRTAQIAAQDFTNDIFGLGYGLQGVRRGMGARFNPIMRVPYYRPSGYVRVA